jgi:glycosyltransferase involved in cell wall biosynthesis
MFRKSGFRTRLVGLWERLAIRLLRRASLVLVDNTEVQDQLTARGVPGSRIRLTWNGVTPPDSNGGARPRVNEVVFCGRLSETKGWRDLVTVAQRLRDDCPGTILRVLGEGDKRQALEQLVDGRGLSETVSIEGFVPDEVKWLAFAGAKAFVSPSREEGWGIAVSEALAAGTEVVCYDLAVYSEIHSAGRLHLVPVGDVEAFATTVVEVLRGSRPPRNVGEEVTGKAGGGLARTWQAIAASELEAARSLTGLGELRGS